MIEIGRNMQFALHVKAKDTRGGMNVRQSASDEQAQPERQLNFGPNCTLSYFQHLILIISAESDEFDMCQICNTEEVLEVNNQIHPAGERVGINLNKESNFNGC
ncbi:hypothetical protein EJB05_37079 [Eragrostis curvula]|uniref:Uncharacterized protein n=1 Tax=Eragrostis curvula TaxID=38414 RepID=A0A5J9TQI5_9POAL|nr:hypothetical protein EJB05_37079 [Eragrostis curvula]